MANEYAEKQKKDLAAKTINTLLMGPFKDKIPTEKEMEQIVELSWKAIEKLEELSGTGIMPVTPVKSGFTKKDFDNMLDI